MLPNSSRCHRKRSRRALFLSLSSLLALPLFLIAAPVSATQLLNVSYDPTRELWRQLNAAFVASEAAQGRTLTIRQSHGGSGSQARAVIDGLEADVVTLALESDTDAIRKAGLIEEGWQKRLPNGSLPYQSTIVFVVRKGNPKNLRDWPDLVQPGVEIVTPNPKTSGNGKLSFLAAWASVVARGGTEAQARELVTKLYRQTPVLDAAARGSTTTFVQKGIGDVHLTWENEAHLEVEEARGEVEIVYPPISILAEPRVAWVDANVKRKGTREVAEAYLRFLYTAEAQDIIGRQFYRPTTPEAVARHAARFPELRLVPVASFAGSWAEANGKFFADRGLFDEIYRGAR